MEERKRMKEGIKRSAISRHIVLILASFLLVTGMFVLFISQTSKAYAVGEVVDSGTDPIMWKIVETSSGQELQIGDQSQSLQLLDATSFNSDYATMEREQGLICKSKSCRKRCRNSTRKSRVAMA